jgi:hypothetical protein
MEVQRLKADPRIKQKAPAIYASWSTSSAVDFTPGRDASAFFSRYQAA